MNDVLEKNEIDAANLRWLADQPHAWVGKNPADGGYACIIRTKKLPWYKGGGWGIVEGDGATASGAISFARMLLS